MKLDDICKEVDKLAKAKGWYGKSSSKPQTGRNLAISLALEAAELLECFQWGESADRSSVEDELADIIIFAAQLSNVLNIDLGTAISNNLKTDKHREW